MTAELHKLGEVLRTAREARGVDLARVERDTKIRERYLSALERGEYRELPGAVYTKGFLRNYGLYLGLDPEYLIDLYRLDNGAAAQERRPAPITTRPLHARRSRAFVITPGVVAAAVLTVMVAVFVVYVATELVTFAGKPDLRITDPAGDLAGVPGPEYTLRGKTAANARITVDGLRGENPNGLADDQGLFAITVKLFPGRNVVTLTARDRLTNRDSDPVTRTITVAAALPSSTPQALAFTAPGEGASIGSPVELKGTAPAAATITIQATRTGSAKPDFTIVDRNGQPVKVTAAPAANPKPIEVVAAADGTFDARISLPAGSWEVKATPAVGAAAVRHLTIPTPKGLTGTLRIRGGDSYVEVDQDGKPKAGVSGGISRDGDSIALTAQRTLRIRAGNAGAVDVTLDGFHVGLMGAPGAVVEWRITLAANGAG